MMRVSAFHQESMVLTNLPSAVPVARRNEDVNATFLVLPMSTRHAPTRRAALGRHRKWCSVREESALASRYFRRNRLEPGPLHIKRDVVATLRLEK